MLRGIDKRNIFLDDNDRESFIKCILKAKEFGNFELYAYCLMNNHVHLLIKEGEEIGNTMRRITVRYVGWHNKKYERTGHLFQNRFKSEPVESERYLITVFRYIHQNPIKAGIVMRIADYPWCSYEHYLHSYKGIYSFIDTKLLSFYFSTPGEFVSFLNAQNDDECLEYDNNKRYKEDTLRKIIIEKFDIDKIFDLPIKERNQMIKSIYHESGASIRQLSRILGVGKTVIEKAIR